MATIKPIVAEASNCMTGDRERHNGSSGREVGRMVVAAEPF
jgi:hypothetical protein